MLQTQVNYWTLVENKRHNLEMENQGRSNLDLGFKTLFETARHNVVGEKETQRHNVQTEQLGWSTLNETIRHNKGTEDLGWANLGETQRHNVKTEGIQAGQLDVGYKQAAAANMQAQSSWSQAETAAARQAMAENQYSNTVLSLGMPESAYKAKVDAYNAETNRMKYETDAKYRPYETVGKFLGDFTPIIGKFIK